MAISERRLCQEIRHNTASPMEDNGAAIVEVFAFQIPTF